MLVHLLGNTEMSMVVRLPHLVSHYFQHHRQDSSLSFLDFLAGHYGGDDGTTADDSEDNKLPMHKQQDVHCFTIIGSAITLASVDFSCPLPVQQKYVTRLQQGESSKHVLLILQPPRLA
jgi:hypothetical protein